MKTKGRTPDRDTLLRTVYTPNDVSVYTMGMIDDRIANRHIGLEFGVADVDERLLPIMPGEFIVVVARTSHGKTAWMQHWARSICRQILRREPDSKKVVAFVEWEVDITEVGFFDLAAATGVDAAKVWRGKVDDVQYESLRVAAAKRATLPIWLLGHSRNRRREIDRLTMEVVHQALLAAEEEWDNEIVCVFLDFLQAIDPIPGLDRRLQIMADVDRARQIGRDLGCPVVVASQASRKVDELKFKLPRMGDNEESSRIEQNADKVLALWWPARSESQGSRLDLPGESLTVTPKLFIVGIRKQRFGPAGQVIPIGFDAARNTFYSLEPGQKVAPHWQDDADDEDEIPF